MILAIITLACVDKGNRDGTAVLLNLEIQFGDSVTELSELARNVLPEGPHAGKKLRGDGHLEFGGEGVGLLGVATVGIKLSE